MILLFKLSDITLPFTDPVLKFLLILLIILIIPVLSDKIKIPHLLGLIIAGIIIGPNGMNLIMRDSSIILSGTAGLLYIMFLAGLEIDMNDFKKNALKSTVLGLYGFLIPMALGITTGIFILGFSPLTSVLLASMFASHTLITYPVVSKLGITKDISVNLSVGSTLITNVLALLVLAVIVGISAGQLDNTFWFKLSVSFILFSLIIALVFPVIARWFFKNFSDSVSQYIFVLTMVFLGAVLSKIAGIEAIIGAFLAGLALNRLIPRTSPLMNRVHFVGNAIFIPFFLIGVGMLIDYRAFFSNWETIKVAITISAIATLGKYLAAWLTQKNFRLSKDQRRVIFGLTNAQAAATLAAVLVGYNIILGYTPTGEAIRLLNDSILNGTIVMILITCTIASFATQRGAQNIALTENTDEESLNNTEKILIPVSNPNTIEELVNLSLMIKSGNNTEGLYALNILSNTHPSPDEEKKARKLLEKIEVSASASDVMLQKLLRYDENIVNGISGVIKEHGITDLVMGLHVKGDISDTFLGKLTEGILSKCDTTTYVYKPLQPISTIKRHLVVIPEHAEMESGFSFWLAKVWNIAMNSGAGMVFYSPARIMKLLQDINSKHPIKADFYFFYQWNNIHELLGQSKKNDNLILALSRKNKPSYHRNMANIPNLLNKYLQNNNFLLVFPIQKTITNEERADLTNPSLLEAVENIDLIGKTIAGIFTKK